MPPRSTATPRPTRSRPSGCSTAERTEVRRNGEWLDMPMEDLFRLARTSTVAQLLERDDFAKRYAGGEPISILELLYPLMQGYDSVAIRVRRRARRHRPEASTCSSRARYRRPTAWSRSRCSRRRSCPGSTACRRCRSRSATTWVSTTRPRRCSESSCGCRTSAMPTYYELLLDETPQADPRDAKRHMAHALTARYHGEEAAGAAQDRFDTVHVRHELPDDIEEFAVQRGQRAGASARPDRGGLRALTLRGSPPARSGRRQARRQ